MKKTYETYLTAPYSGALYEAFGFCSDQCYHQFWQKVYEYPLDRDIGTDIANFESRKTNAWNNAILNAITIGNSGVTESIVPKANLAFKIHTANNPAFPWWLSGTNLPEYEKFYNNAKITLAQNLEKCGRSLDSAKVFEELHMYDKARELREKEKHIVVRKTHISLNLNALLQQIKDGGIVVVYRCPHCGGTLKIGKETSTESLRVCQHCGSEIKSMDIADFLKTALS